MVKKILIAGAGIGGLTAASCLMKAGYDVEIYEQAPELSEIGAGIQLSANAPPSSRPSRWRLAHVSLAHLSAYSLLSEAFCLALL